MVLTHRILSLLSSGLFVLLLGIFVLGASAQEKKKEADANEEKKGKTVGTLTERSDKFIEVKADGEEKARRYVPRWVGGDPAQGGGFDKAMVKAFNQLKIGSRVEVDWVFEERFRAIAVKTLAPPRDAK
jgi:hypothetical protein